MPHIPLLIISSAIFFMQPLYSMESEKKEKKRPSLSLRKKSTDSSSPKQKHTPYDSHDQDHIASVSLITSSRSTSTSPEVSLSQPSKEPIYNRSKTVDTTPIQPKEHHKLSIFSHSESTDKEKTSKQKGYGRSKTVDSASSQPREPFKLKMLSVSDGATSFSSLKISPRSKLTSSAKNIPQANKISPLINAVKNYDLNNIKQYFNEQNANLNQTDQWGNTALYHVVVKLTESINKELQLKEIINLFLLDPRVDTSIKNIHNTTAPQILPAGEKTEIRIPLFARMSLDTRTNHEIGKMLLTHYIHDVPLNDNLITQTIKSIKEKIQITETEKGKNSIDLPQEATLPDYATDEFIYQMINHRIPKEAQHASESEKLDLKNIFAKEVNTIVLNIAIDIDEASIQKSIENILTTINQSHNYLTKFTTKPCIFEILAACVEKQNEENKPKDFFQFYSQNNNNNNNNY